MLTCSVRAAGPILLTLQEAGIDPSLVLRRLAIAPEQLLDSDARLSVVRFLLPLWDLAEELLADSLVGLHAAQNVSRETFDLFSYIAGASSTFGEAASRAVRYFRLITDGGSYEVEREGSDAWWRFRPANATIAACRQDSMFAMAVVVRYVRLWIDPKFAPRLVRFPYTDLPRIAELEAFFRAPVEQGADRCAFRFDAVDLNRPLRAPDPELGRFLERYAADALAALPATGQVSGQVREILARGLSDGDTSLTIVARRLAMSERSLQRQLRIENTTLQRITEELRCELATRYLQRGDLSVSEVAYMLGFSETAPFSRAFKKWTGKTPGDFRRVASGQSPAD